MLIAKQYVKKKARVDVVSMEHASALTLQFAHQCQGLFVQIIKICTTKEIHMWQTRID
jgi:selenocysteine lyase/cysteine desulfurase